MVNLPAEIIENEILLRLPVQILSRFKCVCKHWLHLIKSPSFSHRHYHYHRDGDGDGDGDGGRLIICDYLKDPPAHYMWNRMQRFIEAAAPNQFPPSNDIVELMGPQLGVFCQVTLDGGITLFNPATRMCRQVPPVPVELLRPPPINRRYPPPPALLWVYGFGYVDGYDYKIVVMECYEYPTATASSSVCIYSSATDSWKFIPNNFIQNNSKLSPLHSRSKTFLNGVYYWLVPPYLHTPNNEYVYCVILSFDMRTERFREIQVPEDLVLEFNRDKNLLVDFCSFRNLIQICTRSNSIALLASKGSWVEMWVMDKEGFWSRSVRIRHGDGKLRPYCLWKNELVLGCFRYKDYLRLIDISTEKIRKVAIPPAPTRMHHAFFYKESLVSINGERSYAYAD